MSTQGVRYVPRRNRLSLALQLLSASCACWFGLTERVSAGPVEQLSEVAFGSNDVVVRYENGGGGLIFGDAGGAEARRWQLQCGSAYLAPGEKSQGPMLVLGDGSLLIGSAQGIVALTPDRCSAKRELPTTQGGDVYDLVADPRDPTAAFALLTLPGKPSTRSTLWHRAPDGAWTEFGDSRDGALATSLRATLRDGKLRIYEAAMVPMQDEDAGPRYFVYKLRYSDDGAATFREHVVSADTPPQLIGVDPSNPERVVVLLDRTGKKDSLLVSDDAGAHFKPYLDLAAYGGIAFAPDGRVWIGGADPMAQGDKRDQGVWAAASLATAPQKLPSASYGVQCLGYHAATSQLYACQHFWLGEVDPGSGDFKTLLTFATVDALASCEGAAARCEQQLCNDYCGPAHFATAPACSAYETPNCGAMVAAREAGAPTTSPSMPADRTTSQTPAMTATDAGATTIRPAGAGAAAGRTTPASEAVTQRDESGCNVALERGSSASHTRWLLLCAATWLALLKTRPTRRKARVAERDVVCSAERRPHGRPD